MGQSVKVKVESDQMRSVIGHRIDYNGVGTPRAQRHIPSKN